MSLPSCNRIIWKFGKCVALAFEAEPEEIELFVRSVKGVSG